MCSVVIKGFDSKLSKYAETEQECRNLTNAKVITYRLESYKTWPTTSGQGPNGWWSAF